MYTVLGKSSAITNQLQHVRERRFRHVSFAVNHFFCATHALFTHAYDATLTQPKAQRNDVMTSTTQPLHTHKEGQNEGVIINNQDRLVKKTVGWFSRIRAWTFSTREHQRTLNQCRKKFTYFPDARRGSRNYREPGWVQFVKFNHTDL